MAGKRGSFAAAILCVGAALLLTAPFAFSGQAGKSPVKVFILAGQSNMEGQAVVDLAGRDYNEGKGTLVQVMQDPTKVTLYKHLKNDKGDWAVRDNVWVSYQREGAPLLAGPLSIGYSVYGDKHHFGAELQFGHVIGGCLPNQVLLIKTAWGGKDIRKDFRPPSSGGQVGPYYTKMIEQVREALANLKQRFPDYDGGGYELAGFVWWHGWNDFCGGKAALEEYEQNLVNLIKDVRAELKSPNLPFVVGELTGPWGADCKDKAALAIRKAQADAAARPEYKGTVLFVETHDFVRPAKESPNPTHGHHEFGNAETYFLVGNALGEGMKKLLAASPAPTSKYPIQIVLNASEVPDLKEWCEKVRDVAEKFYPVAAETLSYEGYHPPQRIDLILKKSDKGIAGTGGSRIVCSDGWFRAHPKDVGAIIHETVHVVQSYPRYDPVWLVEGMADYVRYYVFEPENPRRPLNRARIRYQDGYGTTAAFLDWLVRTKDREIVRKLNKALRTGTYNEGLFKEATGKDLDTLWGEFKQSLP